MMHFHAQLLIYSKKGTILRQSFMPADSPFSIRLSEIFVAADQFGAQRQQPRIRTITVSLLKL